jgi:alpha-tubulin suppressor-like RCC1 family protein
MSTTRAIEVLGKGLPVGGGYEPMCAVGVGSVAYCWGKNESGQLGIGSSSSETVLAPDRPVVGNHAFADVAGGVDHACAITITGSAYCWGVGMYGALGDGTGTNSPEPRPVAGNQSFKAIGVGGSFACGLSIGGQVYCWGDNQRSQLGTTTGNCLSYSVPCSATPVPLSGGYGFESIAVGFQQACGITSAGDIYCWGSGFGPTPTRFRSIPADEPGGVRFSIVDIGGNHTCAVSVTGDAWCRGGNHLYQLGNGNNEPTDETVMVIGGIKFRTP